jgi:hypothetical protein
MLKLDSGGLHIRKFAGDATDPFISDAMMLSTTEICESYRIADAKGVIQLDRR